MTRSDRLRAAVVVTGDEVLGGRVAEVNAATIARDLAERGVRLERTVMVGDVRGAIAGLVADLVRSGMDLVCVTGGLGPTADDLTMQAVADAVGRDLELMPDALVMVRERSRGVRRQMHVSDGELEAMRVKQATLPSGSDIIAPVGTAPGCVVQADGTVIVVLPGPPNEAGPMWLDAVTHHAVRDLLSRVDPTPHRVLRTWGVVEAELMTALARLPAREVEMIGTYTRAGEIEVVVAAKRAGDVAAVIEDRFPGSVFARDGEQVEHILAAALLGRGERVAVAESCTGGGVGARLTAVPGSSRWFDGGVIAYSNAVKAGLLGVPDDVLSTFGAVSAECAAAMADGARRATGAHWGLSVTGIAGPDGGTPDKPVGTVCFGVSGPAGSADVVRFANADRATIRRRAETAALHRLRLALQRS